MKRLLLVPKLLVLVVGCADMDTGADDGDPATAALADP